MAKILVVDDQPHVTVCLRVFLGRNGHTVVCADDGAEAIERLRAERFDLLVTDVDMPKLDGLSLVREESVIDPLRGVIILTGRTDFEEIKSLHQTRKIHAIWKPFSPSRLASLVDEIMSAPAGCARRVSLFCRAPIDVEPA